MKTYRVKVTTTYYVDTPGAGEDAACDWAIENHLTETNGIYEEVEAEVVSVLQDTLADEVKEMALPLLEWAVTREYSNRLWDYIGEEVVGDVRENSGYEYGEGFNQTDVRYAIGRVLLSTAEDNYD